ncbi:L-lactate permease [Shigella flexneri]
MVPAFAFVTMYSGMSTTLALVLAGTGVTFPFSHPLLGRPGYPYRLGHFFKRPVWFTAIDHGAANQRLRDSAGGSKYQRWA